MMEYRVWDMTYGGGYMDYSPDGYITYDGNVVEVESENISWGGIDYTINEITENVIVMMYVQMKDINDEKIFVSDIIEDNDGNKMEVIFDSGHTMIKPYNSNKSPEMMFKDDIEKRGYKVVANIYQED